MTSGNGSVGFTSGMLRKISEDIEYMDEGSALSAERLLERGLSEAEEARIMYAVSLVVPSGSSIGIDCALSLVPDALQSFRDGRNGNWEERGVEIASSDPGVFAVRSLQVRKGSTRDDVAVIDLGDVRVCLRWIGGAS